ncbi:MAG: sulfurtransferase [Acidimicrobiales bacterium]
MDALISAEELAAQIGAPNVRIFDCTVYLNKSEGLPFRVESGRETFDAGHIPTSGFIDQVAELSDPDSHLRFTALSPERLAAAFSARGISADTRVVLYDRAFNMWATRVWWLLRSIGFDNAQVLDGGWQAWTSDGRDVSTDPESQAGAGQLTAQPRPGMLVGQAEVEAATRDDTVCLVNALSPEVHDGSDTGYGRAGRIPSSKNVYAVQLVDPETHRFRPLDELRAMFDDAGVAGKRIVTWCGGGIAATSDAFTLMRLGYDNIGIYDGSLSEWQLNGLPLEVDRSIKA